jgi:glutathione S-transferase
VQRAVIVLRAKAIDFKVTYIDLTDKPDWFLRISPHGKVPVLVVDEQPLFESNAIAEYLDEVVPPRLHPESALKRARHRAWTEFVADFADLLGAVYYAASRESLAKGLAEVRPEIAKLEHAIREERGNDGPYFGGATLCLVDAAYAPFLQRFMIVEKKLATGLLDDFPLVRGWAQALLANDCVVGSVASTFREKFDENRRKRNALAA